MSHVPWVEKYRPKSMSDVAHQDEVVAALKKSLESKNLPHLLFYGPPGTGKTSTILAVGRQLYGSEFKNRVLELNASDDRGIDVVRGKVKDFAQSTSSAGQNLPPYKLIILDEADSMTSDAQTALRRTMETYAKTTRFCLICNYVSRVIEPLASRCAKFRFKALNVESMTARLKFICEQEKVPYSDALFLTLNRCSYGDLRKAINLLQSAFSLRKDKMNEQTVIEIAGVVPQETMDKIMNSIKKGTMAPIEKVVTDTIADGYAVQQVLYQLFDMVAVSEDFTAVQKAHIAEKLAQTDKCLQDGADEFIQLLAALAFALKEMR